MTITAANPRVRLPARLILADEVAVAPRLTSKEVLKGVRAPELLCQKLVLVVVVQEGRPEEIESVCPDDPIGSLERVLVAEAYRISPVV